jgi:AraC-like DNA-binding protein
MKHYSWDLKVNPVVNYAIKMIEDQPHQSSNSMITGKTGYSQKHYIKMFNDHVGVTPKDFLKVIRFQKAVSEIEASVDVQWTSVAYDCGYYDQSHFIAEFKNYSGFTPSQYMKQRGDFLNYLPIK